jgi:hypothetical protein
MHKIFVIKLPVKVPHGPNESVLLSRVPCVGEFLSYPGVSEWALVKGVVHCGDAAEDKDHEAEIFVQEVPHLHEIEKVDTEAQKKYVETLKQLAAAKNLKRARQP